jgi:predicted NUDIX family NTP pyrophosphohydrolase
LAYRRRGGELEVFLVHPRGPFWTNKDFGAWSIPKGEHDEAEEPLDAAKRELAEETGLRPEGAFVALDPVRQKSGKLVRAWAVEGDCDPRAIRSNTFSMEWPPRSGRTAEFPEVDRAEWFAVDEARRRILPAQAPLLDQLESLLA